MRWIWRVWSFLQTVVVLIDSIQRSYCKSQNQSKQVWQYSDSTVNRIVVFEGSMNNVAGLTPMRTQILYVIYYKFVLLHLFCSTTMKICFFLFFEKVCPKVIAWLSTFWLFERQKYEDRSLLTCVWNIDLRQIKHF